MPEERLQKLIAAAGLASRRAAEDLILAGRVRVDGQVVRELGFKADPYVAKVEVDGKRLVAEKPVYLVLHKPREVVSTMRDPEGRATVAEHVRGVGARVVPVGRLDYHTSGVLLMTNDGEFANALLHPKKATQKIYVAKVHGEVSDVDLESWQRPIEIDGKRTRPADVRRLRWENGKTWLEISLKEGRNRQIHRLGEATGFPVMRLARLSFAGITAEDLRPGEWRPLSVTELKELKRQYGVPRRVSSAHAPEPGKPVLEKRRSSRGRAADVSPKGRKAAQPATADPRGPARRAAPRGRGASADLFPQGYDSPGARVPERRAPKHRAPAGTDRGAREGASRPVRPARAAGPERAPQVWREERAETQRSGRRAEPRVGATPRRAGAEPRETTQGRSRPERSAQASPSRGARGPARSTALRDRPAERTGAGAGNYRADRPASGASAAAGPARTARPRARAPGADEPERRPGGVPRPKKRPQKR